MPVLPPSPSAGAGARFLSLKWKVLLTLGLLMPVVNGFLSWQHYNDLTQRFELQREAARERLVVEASALHSDFGLRLQALAGMLATLDTGGFDSPPTAAGNTALRPRLDRYWSALQLDFGVASLQVYSADGRPFASWMTGEGANVPQERRVRTVIEREEAMNWTYCQATCTQYAAAPILAAGQAAGAVVLGSSLADLVVSFSRLSGADLAVLIRRAGTDMVSAGERTLPHLGYQVLALSRAERNLPLLQQLSSVPELPAGWAWQLESLGDQAFELSFLAFETSGEGSVQAVMVVMADVTQPLADIKASVWSRLRGELLASLLALLLLALLVHAPLQRMIRAVRAIPLLGRSAFAEARRLIAPRAHRFLEDEIDALDEAAIALSHRLEDLEHEVVVSSTEMRQQRDFSQSLLDTAQVIILTQYADGRILTLNRYGQEIAGWQVIDVAGKRFADLLNDSDSSGSATRHALASIVAGDQQHVQLEEIIVGAGGRRYEITWNHSRLPGREEEDPMIVLSVGIDHTERKRAESHVSYLVEHDPLTGLVNRQQFQHELDRALLDARRMGTDGALLYLDLDGFKYVNDLSGHQAGDALLRIVADEVGNAARSSDLVGRLGGDELGILLHECDRVGAIQVAEKINQRLANVNFPGFGASHRVSASIGIVVFSGSRMNVKQLLANADIAMYQAKAKGGAAWHLYSEGEGVEEKMQSRLHWEELISRSLQNGSFVIHFQPILDIRARQVSHYEALVRMLQPDGSLVAPGLFMQTAEDSGLIRDIDRFVIRKVVATMLNRFARGQNYKFSINLSGVSINDPTLLSFIRKELSRSPSLSSQVIFEITETAAVSDFSAARHFMTSVCELGCAFSLDDFGVGFSSFNYVKQLPVDYVKIDGSFVRTLVDSPDDQVFVRALAEVARGFGKKTIAEFVEDERALNMLRAFGVDFAQGYYIGRPSPEIGGAGL